MAQTSCHKCKQALPHESDSWCLGCSAVEALSAELRNIWGSPGSRSIATDVVVSGLRQVRALRRLGLGGAGVSLASQQSVGVPPGSLPPPEPSVPPRGADPLQAASGVPGTQKVKEERREESDESEEENTSEESEHLGASAQSKAEPAPPLPRRKSRGSETADKAEHTEERERSDRQDKEKRSRTRSRRRHRHRSQEEKKESNLDKKERAKGGRTQASSAWGRGPGAEETETRVRESRGGRRKSHRGGTRHQRLYRAAEDPYKRFHQRRPEGYWDQPLTDFR